MKSYKHLFFDLDRTLWDFESNSAATLSDLYIQFKLENYYPEFKDFHESYRHYNTLCWDLFLAGKVTKEWLKFHRFFDSLQQAGNPDEALAQNLSDAYLPILGTKNTLFPNTLSTLQYLSGKKYSMHIITNGFAEIQYIKLKNSHINHFFETVVTSEEAGYHKPRKEIFARALNSVNAKKKESIMIGDDFESDIQGAKKFGIDQVFFNPDKQTAPAKATYEIYDLQQLTTIL